MKTEKQRLSGAVERARALESVTLDNLFSLSQLWFPVCKLGLVSPPMPYQVVAVYRKAPGPSSSNMP